MSKNGVIKFLYAVAGFSIGFLSCALYVRHMSKTEEDRPALRDDDYFEGYPGLKYITKNNFEMTLRLLDQELIRRGLCLSDGILRKELWNFYKSAEDRDIAEFEVDKQESIADMIYRKYDV